MQFSQQLHHRTPVVSCGLFDLNWTFLHSVGSSQLDVRDTLAFIIAKKTIFEFIADYRIIFNIFDNFGSI